MFTYYFLIPLITILESKYIFRSNCYTLCFALKILYHFMIMTFYFKSMIQILIWPDQRKFSPKNNIKLNNKKTLKKFHLFYNDFYKLNKIIIIPTQNVDMHERLIAQIYVGYYLNIILFLLFSINQGNSIASGLNLFDN